MIINFLPGVYTLVDNMLFLQVPLWISTHLLSSTTHGDFINLPPLFQLAYQPSPYCTVMHTGGVHTYITSAFIEGLCILSSATIDDVLVEFENCSFCTGTCDAGGLFPIDHPQRGVYGK